MIFQWTQADVPGGSAGVWTDNGVCKSLLGGAAPTAVGAALATSADVAVTSGATEAKETAVLKSEKGSPGRRSRFFRL